jgi:hypothetical protein
MSGQDEHEELEGAQPAGPGRHSPRDGQDAVLDVHQRETAGAQRPRRVRAETSERAPATRSPRGARAVRRRSGEHAGGQRPREAAEAAAGGVLASCDEGVARAGLERAAATGAEAQVDLALGDVIPALALPVEAARPVAAALGDPGPVVQVLAPAAPPELIEAVYQDLLGLQRRAGLALAVATGGLLIARLYGGDFGAWRARGPKDDASLRALAERFKAADMTGFSATNLYRAIAVAELVEQLGGVPSLEHRRLTLGHLRAALGAPADERAALLDRAEAEGWTAERLATEAAKLRAPAGERRGRPPLPGFVKTLNQLERMLEVEAEAFGGLEAVEELDAEEAARLYAAATAMREKCEALQGALRGRAGVG